MLRRLVAPLLFPLAVLVHPAVPALAAGPVSVLSLTQEGSGCPPGTVATNIAPDGLAFTILFDSYTASAGPGVPKKERTRECTVDVVLQAPLGWSWAIVGVDQRGYASLPTGTSATLKSSFQFNRQKADHHQAPPLETHLLGPVDRDYFVTTDTPPLQVDWSKCGGTSELHIKTRLEINGPASAGLAILTVDSLDGEVTQLDGTTVCGYRLIWRRCD
jgi:hypothetical protein